MFANSNRRLLPLVASRYKEDLSGVVLIGCQHILGTTTNLLKTLMRKGLKASNIYLIGKCYSTNKTTFKKIKRMGIHIDENSLSFDSHKKFDDQFKNYINNFVSQAISNLKDSHYNKIILLDDGGQLISSFNRLDNFDFEKVRAVEQTSSGFEKISSEDINFPVVNVARSKTKLEIESPIIAKVIFGEIKKFFKKFNLHNPDILVIGHGYVGNSIVKLLGKEYVVDSYDLITHEAPFPGIFAEKIKEYDVLIGSTGKSVLQESEFGLLKSRSFLISASSSDREFSAWKIREKLPKNNNPHLDITFGGITIANSGFPINFSGRKHSAPPNKIMLTRALLLAGVLEASRTNHKKGMIELPDKIQKLIVEKFVA